MCIRANEKDAIERDFEYSRGIRLFENLKFLQSHVKELQEINMKLLSLQERAEWV